MLSLDSKYIQREKFEASIIDGEIIYFKYFEDVVIDTAEILDSFSIHDEFGLDENMKRIIQVERNGTITKAARDLVQQHSRPAIAEAFVIPSLSQKIMFNLYAKLRMRKHPVKAFEQLDIAFEWLKEF